MRRAFRRASRRAGAAGFAAIAAVTAFAAAASAHDVGLSKGDYKVEGSAVSAEISLSQREAMGAWAALDPDRDGVISAAEIEGARGAMKRAIVDRISVKGDGAACAGALANVSLTEEDGLLVRAMYSCPTAPAKVGIEMALLDDLPRGHRHIARVAGTTERVLFQSSKSMELEGAAARAQGAAKSEERPGFVGFFKMGVEHILLGYDHLIFLLGLVLVGGRLRSMLLVITAFTLAHSITLGAAALGLFAPSPRLIEPLIALSIAYVGVENFFVKDAEKRWRITLPFGLIHGFGFAGALREVQLSRAEVPVALVSFNLGVEVGQIAVMAVALPLIMAARKKDWFKDRGVKIASAAIVVAGAFWFVTRALGLDLG